MENTKSVVVHVTVLSADESESKLDHTSFHVPDSCTKDIAVKVAVDVVAKDGAVRTQTLPQNKIQKGVLTGPSGVFPIVPRPPTTHTPQYHTTTASNTKRVLCGPKLSN